MPDMEAMMGPLMEQIMGGMFGGEGGSAPWDAEGGSAPWDDPEGGSGPWENPEGGSGPWENPEDGSVPPGDAPFDGAHIA